MTLIINLLFITLLLCSVYSFFAYHAKRSETKSAFDSLLRNAVAEVKLLAALATQNEQNDKTWLASVWVRLVAHPDLTPEQKSLIRFEYFGNTTTRVETCRGALVNYFIQDACAATDVKKQHLPDCQLAVANLEEVKPWLFPN